MIPEGSHPVLNKFMNTYAATIQKCSLTIFKNANEFNIYLFFVKISIFTIGTANVHKQKSNFLIGLHIYF